MQRLLKAAMPVLGVSGLVKYLILGLLSGVSSFLFIHFVNKAVGFIIEGQFADKRLTYAFIFTGVIILFIIIRRVLSLGIIRLSQSLFWNIRKQILQSVLNANYQQVSGKRLDIHAAIVTDVNVLTNVSLTIIGFFTSTILAVAALVYLAYISLPLFVATFIVALSGTIIYLYGTKKTNARFQRARKLERNFLSSMNTILDGFREIYMEPKIGKAVYDLKIKMVSREAYKNNVEGFTRFLNNQITGQVLFYMLISGILLLLGVVFNIKVNEVVSFVFTLLYLLGAIETVMTSLPGLMRAKISADRMLDLTGDLEINNTRNRVPQRYISKDAFEHIAVRGLEFRYGNQQQDFGVGPVDLDIRKGDVIFIYGGNGSGKTTFIQAVIGLIIPVAGTISLNGTLIGSSNYPEYRTLFSIVFSDFHLFEELYSIPHPDINKWQGYLQLFELEGKVTLEGNRFSTTNLSMGQRKRLALIACLMEDKPVLILDEWAADQDPYFRKKFYTEIIPALKQEGVTIIAITHDDKYYHCADRLYKMDYGQLVGEHIDEYTANLY